MLLTSIASLLGIAMVVAVTSSVDTGPRAEIITDFCGNEFLLKEGNNYYEIWSLDNVFIEGSYTTNSPYYQQNGDKYYLGPTNYFVKCDELVTNLITNSIEPLSNYYNYSYELLSNAQNRSSIPSPDTNKTYVDKNGFTVIKEADYFRNLTAFPQNWFGECGVIALSELLGYYDTFYNDDFIPNDLTYDARYYVKKVSTRSSESSEYELDKTITEPLTKIVSVSYKDTNYYSFNEWNSMPGTTFAMRDYIFDKYMKTFLGIGWPDGGYPMLDEELKDTFKNYMKNNCGNLLSCTEFRSGNVFYTHQKPKEYISEGLPTLLVLQSYNSNLGDGDHHDVLAYGYKDDTFLTHFGWWPNKKRGAEVVLNSSTIYGYFTIKYNGEHKHSFNVSMNKGNITKYICGCGDVHHTNYSIAPSDWEFDQRYYFENEGIKTNVLNVGDLDIDTKRLRCGYIEDKYINLSPNRYGAGYAYLDLSFNKKVYGLNTKLSFWSGGEGLYTSSGDYAYIKYLDSNGDWQILLDLLKSNLKTDNSNQDYFALEIPNGTLQIIIECYKKSPNTNRNKERICIGNTTLITK